MTRNVPIAALALFLAGCVSTGDFEQLQNQVSELQEELANIKRTAAGKDEVQNVNQRIADQTESLLRSNAALVAKVDAIEDGVQNSQGAIEQATYRMDQLAQQVTQVQSDVADLKARSAAASPSADGAPVGEVTVAPPVTTAQGDPVAVYQSALRDYQRANYDLAIAGFRDFVDRSPNSDLADNASYWIGESLFSQKKYKEAVEQFDTVVNRFPKSDKVPAALLKKGYAYLTLGERAQGIVQLQYVVHEHPKSQEASLARQRLRQLGVETR